MTSALRNPDRWDVGLLLPCLLVGGTEVATLETASAFQALGCSVAVVVYFDEVDPTMLATFREKGLQVQLLGVPRGNGLLSFWGLAMGLQQVLRRGRFDLVWVQYMTPTLLPLAVSRLFTQRLVAAVHVAASHYSPAGLGRMRWLARHWCARFVCVSGAVANGIFRSAGDVERFAGRVVVIPNALDMTAMRASLKRDWRIELGWPRDVVVVGFWGRLAHVKGVDVLLNAVARLHRQGVPIRLVIVGEGAEQASLQVLSQRLGVGAITHFAGQLPRGEIFSALKGFDMAVMPSREGLEGFGLSALEAMAAGVPVVASRVDALNEVVVDGATGLLCPADDPVNLAEAIARLMSDSALRQRMGAAGVAHVESSYDAPAFRAHLAGLLTGLGLPVRAVV